MNAQSIATRESKADAEIGHEMSAHDLGVFEAARSGLMAIAYRILGSRADAEDAVQDCFLKWRNANRGAIASPIGWLATVCNHRCLDLLRTARHSRLDYVGASICAAIEPLGPHGIDSDSPASLKMAFSQMLQRLTPKERAAYVLCEIFEQSIPVVAATLQTSAGACQKLIERARVHIARQKVRCATPADTQVRLLHAFESAIATGDPAQLAVLLARDARANGGKASAALRVLEGCKRPVCILTHELHGDHSDDIANRPVSNATCIDHRRKRQDRQSSQRAA